MQGSTKPWKRRRVKTPTVLQMEAVECGAACLAMILACHGLYLPLEVLRVDCGISRDGSKASNILKAARKYGTTARGFRKEPEGLRHLPLPMILFWNFNHFVVLEGIKGKRAYINDPGAGPRKITLEELDRSFTGVVLTFEPGKDFRKGGEKPNIVRSLTRRFTGCGKALAYVVLAGLFLIIPGLVFPTYTKIFLDDVLIQGYVSWLRPLLLAMGVTALASLALTWLQRYFLLRFDLRLALSGSSRFFHHVLRLPISFFTQRFAGDLASRVQLNDRVAQLLSGQLAVTMVHLITVSFYAVIMFQYSVLLTLIGIGFAMLNLVALKIASYRRKNVNMALQQDIGKLMGQTMTGLQMIETLKAGGAEGDFFSVWAGYQTKVVNSRQRLSVSTQLLSAVPATLLSLNHTIMLFVGAVLIMNGQMTIGMLFALQALMMGFMQPFSHFVDMGSMLQETHADINRLDDVTANPMDSRFSEEAVKREDWPDRSVKLTGRLELKQITFGYSPLEPPLIKEFSLTLQPGARVALVGASGSGKSTVAKLVTGLYEPWEGEILFDGRPIAAIPRRIFTNSVAMVDQDIFLFDGTIRENLTMWDPTVLETFVIQAAKDACIHDDIMQRPDGYDGEVNEAGANFSGGEGQRLEIARALTGEPTFLILDEATSALDPETEMQVDSHLRRRGVTCLIVAHRLSTIRDCDEIIVMDRGAVVQRGTHTELRDREGRYAELIKAQ
ncbi:MAG: NHLP family bacteriocin export ABC transporter peptidase/permease/ATPase subunit [Deltaproteobacteria bacterium]|nr:NHLP family bacteriocin export ABC transporter peptidase/permease/ATPase subunit [Deltaproteobacteria bacterium]